MYSIKLTPNLKYIVTCISNGNNVAVVDTLFDTGARYTCYRAAVIDKTLTEQQFKDNESPILALRGFVKEHGYIKFYKYSVKQFTIRNIDLGPQDIWITFDKQLGFSVLGMDILRKVTFFQSGDTRRLCLFRDATEAKEFFNLYYNGVIHCTYYETSPTTLCVIHDDIISYVDKSKVLHDNTGDFVVIGGQRCYLDYQANKHGEPV